MRDRGVDGNRAALGKLLRGADQGTRGDGEVINDQRGSSLYLADDLEDLGAFVMSLALFVRDRD